MSRLDQEARMTIKALAARGATNSEIARLLGVTEGAVRYQVKRFERGLTDGRARQPFKAEAVAAAIAQWRVSQADGPINLAALHGWLRCEHGYTGSLRSVQRFWRSAYPAPAIRARRRVETPPGAQAQVDWAYFPGVILAGIPTDLVALHMVLSFSRKPAIVWSPTKDMLAWLGCHSACFTRLGGVPATVRIDNEKTAIARGAGAWGVINPTYRRYAATMTFHIDACPRIASPKNAPDTDGRCLIFMLPASLRALRAPSLDPMTRTPWPMPHPGARFSDAAGVCADAARSTGQD
ncbi:helix-turn-helix domain-containing protein, partial [Microvirga tunisiensis]|uniref:helix-turn-helix domain-containing protein n=1 Tax=Microvirga tunisiensis TaxID=2108360 RepID=UPI0012C51B49